MGKVRTLETINLLRKHDLGVPYFSPTYKWLACQQGIDTRRLTLHPPFKDMHESCTLPYRHWLGTPPLA